MNCILRIVFTTAFVCTAFSTAVALAEPYWVFFSGGPGRQPGDPVERAAIGRVEASGAAVRTVSRYFNAVSVDFGGDPTALARIRGVASVGHVRVLGRKAPESVPAHASAWKPAASAVDTTRGYGLLYDELAMLGIPAVHERGYDGTGVVIGVLDSGFDGLADTPCLASAKIIARRNFLLGGEVLSGSGHGTMVLACLAGGKYGEYRGAAPGASYLLAVTDEEKKETRADEDRWVAAVEWCDSLGADIISSSLVYNEFDDPKESYTKDQMDGRTSLVARAAEIAVSRGIVVVNAVGNEGNLPWRIVTTPGDAEHVVSVGAVTVTEPPFISVFSSRGPTADGRIKPDVVSPGVTVSLPVPGTASYTANSGTSFATPFVAGLCALILQARPGVSPAGVMDALRKTARDLGDPGPDTSYGWGLANGPAALDWFGTAVEGGVVDAVPALFRLLAPYPNPFNPRVAIPFRVYETARMTVEVFDITGRKVTVVADGPVVPGMREAVWNAEGCAAGVYFVRAKARGFTETRRIALVK